MKDIYRLAGLVIQLESVHDAVHQLCMKYRFDGIPCFAVRTTTADIAYEREKAARADIKEGRGIIPWPDGYLETLAVYRRIAERLPEYGGFVFHGSAIAVDGCGYVFTAKSGTGKSTHARLWRELLGDRAVMVNDDKPIIRVTDGAPFVFGTPWDGKEHLSRNISVPLKAVCILERSAENRIREISKQEALPTLVRQAYRPFDPPALSKTVDLLDRLNVRYYRLGCNMDISAAELSFTSMKEGSR